MLFTLAFHLHQPVSLLVRLVPAAELVEWVAWFELSQTREANTVTQNPTADQQYAQLRKVLG